MGVSTGSFHAGEREVQRRAGLADEAQAVGRIVGDAISPAAARFLETQRLAIAASLDASGQPWASVLSGPAGFLRTVDPRRLRIAAVPADDDPLAANLRVRPEIGLLVIDPQTRRRMRVNGRGTLDRDGVVVRTDEVYGNCPKYIQKRRLIGGDGSPAGEARRSSSLDERARALVAGADTLFTATWHPGGGADASHRGGRPGFVRVRDERTLEFPDYPGNNMFNTLGNLVTNPGVGLLIVDFEHGDLLQLTGRARILWEPERVVRVELEEVLVTPGGSPLRFELVGPWPANPPLGGIP
jgi:predicted pyridoxine 5'-phosphate oxidase superfamily flavin-nucleotide-binding protein